MNKIFLITLVSMCGVANLWAQDDIEKRLDSELERVYDAEESVAKLKRTKNAASNIYIYNNQDQNAKQNAIHDQNAVQDQPATLVQAGPLIESESSRIRGARKQMEVQTEEKIVEKLEYSRMEDEKRRADKLFGGKWDVRSSDDCSDPCASTVSSCSNKCLIKEEPKKEVIIVKEQISEDSSLTSSVELESTETSTRNYIFGIVGTQDYIEASNVDAGTALGVGIGMEFASNFAIEGGFTYSKAELSNLGGTVSNRGFHSRRFVQLANRNVDQLSLNSAIKYIVKIGRVKPFVGGTIAGVYRMYDDNSTVFNQNDTDNTLSLDVGLTTGIDLSVTNNFSLGADLRYAQNISNNRKDEVASFFRNSNIKTLEEMDYSAILLNAKFNF